MNINSIFNKADNLRYELCKSCTRPDYIEAESFKYKIECLEANNKKLKDKYGLLVDKYNTTKENVEALRIWKRNKEDYIAFIEDRIRLLYGDRAFENIYKTVNRPKEISIETIKETIVRKKLDIQQGKYLK